MFTMNIYEPFISTETRPRFSIATSLSSEAPADHGSITKSAIDH